jgi:hypothetical protein
MKYIVRGAGRLLARADRLVAMNTPQRVDDRRDITTAAAAGVTAGKHLVVVFQELRGGRAHVGEARPARDRETRVAQGLTRHVGEQAPHGVGEGRHAA